MHISRLTHRELFPRTAAKLLKRASPKVSSALTDARGTTIVADLRYRLNFEEGSNADQRGQQACTLYNTGAV